MLQLAAQASCRGHPLSSNVRRHNYHMRLSQRAGLTPATKLAQRESMDDDLRASLWSLLSLFYWDKYEAPGSGLYGRSDHVHKSNMHPLMLSFWLHYFKRPTDTIDKYWEECFGRLRKHFFQAQWYEVYDFVEFVANYGPDSTKPKFIELVNSYLERENSAYRFVGDQIAEITSAEEIESVETALSVGDDIGGQERICKLHLRCYRTGKALTIGTQLRKALAQLSRLRADWPMTTPVR